MTPAQQTLQKIASLVFLIFAAIGITAPAFAEPLDTTKVPRMPGAKEDYATPDTTIFTSPEPVEATGKALRALLTADGWILYDAPPYEEQTEADYEHQNFKKSPHGLSVYVSSAPAKNNATSVQYDDRPLKYDLPVPKDATKLGYSRTAAHLECISAQSIDALLEFYRTELTARGWTRWSPPDTSKPKSANEASGKSLRTHFVKDGENPLLFILDATKPDGTIVYLKAVPSEEMLAEYAPKPAPQPAAEPPTPEKSIATEDDEDAEEDAGVKFESLVKDLIKEHLKPPKTAKKEAPAETAVENTAPLGVLAGNTAPIPLPATAEEVEHKGDRGSLEFTTTSSVKSVATFYREQMKALGWKEQKTVINSDTMVSLQFKKGKDDLGFTIMRMGKKVDVDADSDILKTASETASAASPAAPSTATPAIAEPSSIEIAAPAKEEIAEKDLQVEIMSTGKLPVPKPYSYAGGTKSKFRYEANASVSASIASVAGFYRTELTKLGWKEEAGAKVETEKADLSFTTPKGPARLQLSRQNGETVVALLQRDLEAAKTSGLMPKSGQAKIMFGNIEDNAATVTIGKQQIKVISGETADRPYSPGVELAPGTYKVSVKQGGKDKAEEVVVGADEIWGVLVGPNGVLPLQMY